MVHRTWVGRCPWTAVGEPTWGGAPLAAAPAGAGWGPLCMRAASSRHGQRLTPAQHGFQQRGPVREEGSRGQEAQLL